MLSHWSPKSPIHLGKVARFVARQNKVIVGSVRFSNKVARLATLLPPSGRKLAAPH